MRKHPRINGASFKLSIFKGNCMNKAQKGNTVKIDNKQIAGNIRPKIGQKFQFKTSKGGMKNVYVTDIQKKVITIDANHPLTGRTVDLEMTLLELE